MDYKKPRTNPEAAGANRLSRLMRRKGWMIWKHGAGKFVSGWPDYYAAHPSWGTKWIETKAPGGKLRPSQIKRFSAMSKYGVEIWVLEDERDYMKLFKKPNWRMYM